jgi:hypothetical protein
MNIDGKEFLTTSDVCSLYNVHRVLVKRLRDMGMPYKIFGVKKFLYLKEDVEKWILRNK